MRMLSKSDRQKLYNELYEIQDGLIDMKVQLKEAQRANKQYEHLKKRETELEDTLNKCNYYKKAMTILNNVSEKEDAKFKESRIRFLESSIDDNINRIFPEKGYKSKVNFDYRNKSSKASLVLVDNHGVERMPEHTEGGFMKQLIGFTSATSLVECLGITILYVDEAFSASDEENKSKVADILKMCIDRGMQIFLVSQSDELYKNLPRRQFNLKQQHNANSLDAIVIDSVEDY